jgi:hypothetical protein
MSLDVMLTMPRIAILPNEITGEPRQAIFIRRDGATVEISRAEWDAMNTGREPVTATVCADEVYTRNITHNLVPMAKAAGLYEACWHPEEIGVTKARDLAGLLRAGLVVLLCDPKRFKALNPANGWGDYDGLVAFVASYAVACAEWPDAEVSTST